MIRFCKHLMSMALVYGVCSAHVHAQPSWSPTTLAAWVQYTANGVEARAVVTSECPVIRINGSRVRMSVRAEATSEHPDVVCMANLPEKWRSVRLGGRTPPIPKKNPRRIVVVGDTGCRLSDGHGLYQECANDSLWPFKYVAQAVADYQPDLIIYTGDYIYREAACPEGDNGCLDSPYGDNQATWLKDWLTPAMPVHLAAPMVLVRGNHETCGRAGEGWFRYLDAFEFPDLCVDNTPPWTVKTSKFSLGVMDTARVEDGSGMDLTRFFARQLETLQATLAKDNVWITTHRPFWGFGADDDTGELTRPTETLQNAVEVAGLPGKTRMIISAHIHLAEIIGFKGDRPPQLVVANGGTQLVPRVDPPSSIAGMDIDRELVLYQYGFVTLEPRGNSNKVRVGFRDIEGRELERCHINKQRVRCPPSELVVTRPE